MPNPPLRRKPVPVFGLVLTILALALPARLAADLVWTPQGGWRVEGGALSGLTGTDGRNAIELMDRTIKTLAQTRWSVTSGLSQTTW